MKDGYYLSAYLDINELACISGTSTRHDQNISLWRKTGSVVELVHYWELERLSGIKQHEIALYDTRQAAELINELLRPYKISLDDIIEIWGTKRLDTTDDYHSLNDYPCLSYHSVAHLFSTVMMDTEKFYCENILGLAVDGGPDSGVDTGAYDKSFYSGCYVQKGRIELFRVSSPAYMWVLAAVYFELKEGTLMALASASKSEAGFSLEYRGQIYGKDDFDIFNHCFINFVNKVNGLAKEDEGVLFNYFDPAFTPEENKISMVMKEIQRLSEKQMEEMIGSAIVQYDIKPEETYLALSGGFALNCPTNSGLMKRFKFKGFIAPPSVNDSGISLGIALYAFYKRSGRFKFNLSHAYYGDSDLELEKILNHDNLFFGYIKSVSDFNPEQAVSDITEAPVIWFDGRAEIGPRALGNRSILGDPSKPETKEILNLVKKRQWWRPVAPIILEEDLEEWFEDAYPSPYMLNTFTIREHKKGHVPAILHLDDTARVQTLGNITCQDLLYKLICAFRNKTGIPMLCNTSLNDRGEPIINKIEEALNFALRKKIHIVYINGARVELSDHEQYTDTRPLLRHPVIGGSCENDEMLKFLNPHNVPKYIIRMYYTSQEYYLKYDLTREEDIKKLLNDVQAWKEKYAAILGRNQQMEMYGEGKNG